MSHGTRAKGKVRRYCRANRVRFLWTLTYAAEPPSRRCVTRDLRWFQQQMRRTFGRLALCLVVEEGAEGGRLHVHFGAPRFLSIEKIRRAWGRGHVHVGDPRKMPGRVPVRKLAAYLAKYVAKDLDQADEATPKGRAGGEHRYFVTQGFSPAAWRLRYGTQAAAVERMLGLYGHPDVTVPFGDAETDPIYGVWFQFPDEYLHPPPRPG